MMRPVEVLRKIGLTQNEIKVYLALNKSGSAKAGKAAKLAKIDRSQCYDVLRSLGEKGLTSYVTIGRVKWFQVAGPRRLLDYIKEQEEDVRTILPELETQHAANEIEGQVRLFKGIRGVKSIFLDIIKTGKNNYVFGSEGQFSARMPEFALQFNRLKKEKGITTKLLIRKGRSELDAKKSVHRFLPGVKGSPAVTNIYGEKIAIIIWTDEPEGIIIENKAAAQAYKSYFNFLWQQGQDIKIPHKDL